MAETKTAQNEQKQEVKIKTVSEKQAVIPPVNEKIFELIARKTENGVTTIIEAMPVTDVGCHVMMTIIAGDTATANISFTKGIRIIKHPKTGKCTLWDLTGGYMSELGVEVR